MQDDCRILIVYFSRTGTTGRLADLLASLLHATVVRIRESKGPKVRLGVHGYVRSLVDVLRRRSARLLPDAQDLGEYDVVVVGTPVWASRVSTPVSTWLVANQHQLRHVAFFCSLGGRGSESAFAQMQADSGKSPIATCAVTTRDLNRGDDYVRLEAFARKIGRRRAALEEMESML